MLKWLTQLKARESSGIEMHEVLPVIALLSYDLPEGMHTGEVQVLMTTHTHSFCLFDSLLVADFFTNDFIAPLGKRNGVTHLHCFTIAKSIQSGKHILLC